MTTSDQTTPPTLETQQAATLPERLPLGGMTLLGTVVAGTTARALLRMKDGAVLQVTPGVQIGRMTVAAIEPGLIHFIRNGETQQLALP